MRAVATLFIITLLCGPGGWTPRVQADSVVHYIIEPGRDLAAGRETTLSSANGASFYVAGSQSAVYFQAWPANSDVDATLACSLDFGVPGGAVLAVGDYPNATEWEGWYQQTPGMSFYGAGIGGTPSAGHFQILEISFDANGRVATMAANFVTHIQGNTAAIYGELRFNSSVPYTTSAGVAELSADNFLVHATDGAVAVTVGRHAGSSGTLAVDYATADGTDLDGRDYTGVSGTLTWADGDTADKTITIPIHDSGNPLQGSSGTFGLRLSGPGAGTQNAAVVTVLNADSTTTFLHYDSDYGDNGGGGVERTFNLKGGYLIVPSRNQYGGVSVTVAHADGSWPGPPDIDFAPAPGQTFGVGDYQNVVRYPFQTGTTHPGLDYGGGGNTVTGNFQVLEAVFASDGKVLKFAANFEQHEDGFVPGMYGQIRYNSTVAVPPPAPTTVALSVSNPVVSDNGLFPGIFNLVRTGPATDTVIVRYQMVGSAVNGRDYVFLSGAKKIKAGRKTANIVVYPIDLTTGQEGGRSVIAKLRLLPQSGYTIVGGNTAKVRIYQDYQD